MSNTVKRKKREEKIIKDKKRTSGGADKKGILITADVIGAAVLALVTFIAVRDYEETDLSNLTPSTEYSKYLDFRGNLQDVKPEKLVGDFDVDDIVVYADDVNVSESTIDEEIAQLQDEYAVLGTDKELTADTGDKISVSYVGRIDNVRQDGYTAENKDVTLGSGYLPEEAEEALTGLHPGDTTEVTVTVGDDTEMNVELTLNGVYIQQELTDEHVREVFPQYNTVEEYKAALAVQEREENIINAIEEYLYDNLALTEYPAKYLHHSAELLMTLQAAEFLQYKTIYENYGIEFEYESYKDYFVDEGSDYETTLINAAKQEVALDVFYQYVAEKQGIEVTAQTFKEHVDKYGISDEDIEYYGRPYFYKSIRAQKVLEWMAKNIRLKEGSAENHTGHIHTDSGTEQAVSGTAEEEQNEAVVSEDGTVEVAETPSENAGETGEGEPVETGDGDITENGAEETENAAEEASAGEASTEAQTGMLDQYGIEGENGEQILLSDLDPEEYEVRYERYNPETGEWVVTESNVEDKTGEDGEEGEESTVR